MREAASDRRRNRAVGPARLPLLVSACAKLLVIAILMAVHSHARRAGGGSGDSGGSGGGGGEVAPAQKHAPTTLLWPRRALTAQQPSPEPAMSTSAQARFLPPTGPEDGGGSVLLPGLVAPGTQLGPPPGDSLQPSAAACCAACRADPQCTAFSYCNREAGCTDAALNLTAPYQGCQLVHQNETAPGTGRPVLLVPAADFVGGAPLRFAAPPVEGYDAYPGLGFWYRYDVSCDASVSQPGSCGLDGGPAQNAPRCSADPDCQVMMWFPDGRDYPGAGRPVVLLKGGPGAGPMDIADANINLNAVLYRKKAAAGTAAGSSGGGLSAGAVAGIAVAAACAALALAGAAIVFVRRRRQQRQHVARQQDKVGRGSTPSCDASASSCGMMDASYKNSWAGQSAPAVLGLAGGALAGSGAAPSSSSGLSTAAGGTAASSWPAANGGFSRLALPTSPEQQLGTGVPWAEGSAASPLSSLPLGQGRSLTGSGQQLIANGKMCPPAPPATATNSIAPGCVPHGGTAAAARVQVPVAAPSQLPGTATRGTAQPLPLPTSPRVAPPAAGAAAQSLLSQLPTYGWQRCLVDYAAIQFVGDGDGQPVVLGEGASATVYQVLLNGVEPHAAKVFRLGSDPRAQLDFLEEASLLRLLRHRSVVGFAGVCVARGHGIILMELMEGGDLRSRNAEVDEWGLRRFGWYQRGKTVALDIATAMHYLHSSSYTHFDIKSRNVLLSRDLTAKLADVGFTRAMRTTHHSVEGPIGTLDYMAPELLLNNSKCTNAVDTYSFGCLLHEICTGKYPSRGCLRDIHVPLEAPAEVAALVAACLQEDPARRPTARQLVQALMDLQ